MVLARALMRRTEKGKAYGAITAKALAVLEALLWGFHNARSGLCFPSYETIAERAGCARSTVAEAIKALEEAGILSWVNRITRVAGALRGPVRPLRHPLARHPHQQRLPVQTAAQEARLPVVNSSKSDFPSGTSIQELSSSGTNPAPAPLDPDTPLGAALLRFKTALTAATERK